MEGFLLAGETYSSTIAHCLAALAPLADNDDGDDMVGFSRVYAEEIE